LKIINKILGQTCETIAVCVIYFYFAGWQKSWIIYLNFELIWKNEKLIWEIRWLIIKYVKPNYIFQKLLSRIKKQIQYFTWKLYISEKEKKRFKKDKTNNWEIKIIELRKIVWNKNFLLKLPKFLNYK
jgi:rRNA processing protein Gar1